MNLTVRVLGGDDRWIPAWFDGQTATCIAGPISTAAPLRITYPAGPESRRLASDFRWLLDAAGYTSIELVETPK